jgi:hypothetical protein
MSRTVENRVPSSWAIGRLCLNLILEDWSAGRRENEILARHVRRMVLGNEKVETCFNRFAHQSLIYFLFIHLSQPSFPSSLSVPQTTTKNHSKSISKKSAL